MPASTYVHIDQPAIHTLACIYSSEPATIHGSESEEGARRRTKGAAVQGGNGRLGCGAAWPAAGRRSMEPKHGDAGCS